MFVFTVYELYFSFRTHEQIIHPKDRESIIKDKEDGWTASPVRVPLQFYVRLTQKTNTAKKIPIGTRK